MIETSIERMQSEIETAKNIDLDDDIELYIMKRVRDNLIKIGFSESQAAVAASSTRINIDFNLEDEEEVEVVNNYIDSVVKYMIKRSISLAKIGENKVKQSTVIECFREIMRRTEITMD